MATDRKSPASLPDAAIAARIWDLKYRLKRPDGSSSEKTLNDTLRRVARAAAAAEKPADRKRWEKTFLEAMAGLEFIPAGRILAGAGSRRRVTLFNCFVMGPIGDDLSAIFENVREAALTMQQGGGIGHDFSTLRPRGALVRSVAADASGPVSFMDVWDAMCRTIMSAGQRRGAMMATLRCDHPDIEEFISAKQDPARLRNFNLSVLVTDAFIAAVRADADWPLVFAGKTYRTVKARALWQKIVRSTYEVAEPGVIFIDRVNAENNLSYCETIASTNPCVTAETWVHTSLGPRQVADLVGRSFVARVGGQDVVSAADGFFMTGRKPVLRLETAEGHRLRLTADHRVRRISMRSRWRTDSEWVAAGTLRPGDEVVLDNHRSASTWPGVLSVEQGYLLGLLVGDGTLESDKAVLSAWRPKMACGAETVALGVDGVMVEALRAARTLPHRSDFAGWQAVGGRDEQRLALGALRHLALSLGMSPGNKSITPALERSSSDGHRGFLRGLFDADGSVQGDQRKGVSIRLSQSSLERLEAAQRMLLRLGIASTIYRERRPIGDRSLPDGRGGTALYRTAANHELVIAGDNLSVFDALIGFADSDKATRLTRLLSGYKRRLNREAFVATVAGVYPDGEADVYDVSVPRTNCFDANGIVAHNCGEQPLPPYGACLLGSINLARLVRAPFERDAALDEARLTELTATAVRFLDDIIDVSRYPLSAQRAEAMAKRRIGLGVTGLADALIQCGVRYGTPEAVKLAGRWMQTIAETASRASAALAAEKGAFPLCDSTALLARPNLQRLPQDIRDAIAAHGLRNGLLTSIAPTGTISLLAGNVSSGVEPVFDFRLKRRMLARDGTAHEEVIEDYALRLYRHLKGASAPLTDAFVRADELTPSQHLEMQAALQAHVDSSISKTINCPADMPFEAFERVYLEAYELGLKGCTTFRPNAITGTVLSATHEVSGPNSGMAPAVAAERAVGHAGGVPRARPAPVTPADVVYMSQPLERDQVLPGFTYKLRWPDSDHAIYVTLNDIERDGRRRPFEIFINSKNLEHYAWTVALTRMISAVFRRGGDVTFVVDELKAVFDPRGGQWMEGRYVPSLLAAIGGIIELHMLRTGFLRVEGEQHADLPQPKGLLVPSGVTAASLEVETIGDAAGAGSAMAPGARGAATPAPARTIARGMEAIAGNSRTGRAARSCPRCSMPAMIQQEGCLVCLECGYSKCG